VTDHYLMLIAAKGMIASLREAVHPFKRGGIVIMKVLQYLLTGNHLLWGFLLIFQTVLVIFP